MQRKTDWSTRVAILREGTRTRRQHQQASQDSLTNIQNHFFSLAEARGEGSTGALDESSGSFVGLILSRLRRWFAKYLSVESDVIIPRIHVASNKRRVN